jgi:hypothetical protein
MMVLPRRSTRCCQCWGNHLSFCIEIKPKPVSSLSKWTDGGWTSSPRLGCGLPRQRSAMMPGPSGAAKAYAGRLCLPRPFGPGVRPSRAAWAPRFHEPDRQDM